jgi:hypothetical protein
MLAENAMLVNTDAADELQLIAGSRPHAGVYMLGQRNYDPYVALKRSKHALSCKRCTERFTLVVQLIMQQAQQHIARHHTLRNCSVDIAPLVPALKLSMNRTQLRSRGTVVPPDVTHAMGTVSCPSGPLCLSKKAVS